MYLFYYLFIYSSLFTIKKYLKYERKMIAPKPRGKNNSVVKLDAIDSGFSRETLKHREKTNLPATSPFF